LARVKVVQEKEKKGRKNKKTKQKELRKKEEKNMYSCQLSARSPPLLTVKAVLLPKSQCDRHIPVGSGCFVFFVIYGTGVS
jgi:hypothetical protein